MKICSKCKLSKETTEFHKHPTQASGLSPRCKECRKQDSKISYLNRREKVKAKTSAYYYKNKEILYKKNRARNIKRLKTDKAYKLTRRLRNRLYYALKNKNWKKNTHFSEYIGCSREELVQHIEKQFKPGMTWENHGQHTWHIDHIIPLNSAKDEKELYKLCHFTNLQPMWAKENYSKGAKLTIEYQVKQIANKDSHSLILNVHYAKRLPPIQYAFGLFQYNQLVGVCTFSIPSGRSVPSYITTEPHRVLELNRLVLVNNKKNEASILVSRAIKLLPKNAIIVSFADSAMNHRGIVYQACNFKYYGLTLKRKEFRSPNGEHARTACENREENGATLVNRSQKHRYIYVLDKDYSVIKLEEKKYPK